MATLSIDMSDETSERVCAAFAATYPQPEGYEGTSDDWLKERVVSFINEVTLGYERNQAIEAARQAADDAAQDVVLS